MKLEEFRRHLDTHGGDLSRWPTRHARAGQRLLAADARAAQTLALAQALERTARTALRSQHASEALRLRLQRIPAHYPQPTRVHASAAIDLHRWLLGGALLAATTASLGFAAGFVGVFAPAFGLDFAELAYGGLL